MTTADASPPPPPRYEPLPDPVVPTFTVHPPTEPRDQERTMTSPTQRRHDEILGRLDALIDAVTPGDKQPGPEPVDVTEEPPVGSQVTDKDGDVWQRDARTSWNLIAYQGDIGNHADEPWYAVRQYAPLRPTTDADRERVGIAPSLHRLEDVAAEFGVDLDAPDVDPDEALNRAVAEAIDDVSPPPPAPWDADWLDRATAAAIRAAREHIEAEVRGCYIEEVETLIGRAKKAEAEVERLTYLLGTHADGHRCTCEMTGPGTPGVEPDSWEQDPLCPTHPDMDYVLVEFKRLTRERDDLRDRVDDLIRERGQAIDRTETTRQALVAADSRYRALRADVERTEGSWGEPYYSRRQLLARDDERAK